MTNFTILMQLRHLKFLHNSGNLQQKQTKHFKPKKKLLRGDAAQVFLVNSLFINKQIIYNLLNNNQVVN